MSYESKPLVSVIIPTFSRADHIVNTINSILSQSYPNIEIIIVDDNGLGTDTQKTTQKTLQKYIDDNIIIYIPHDKNKNGSAARNTGIRASKGEYICFLDDDDQYHRKKIEKQLETIQDLPEEYGAVFCNVKYIYHTNNGSKETEYVLPQKEDLTQEILLMKTHALTPIMMYRRKVFDSIMWDESLKRHQDPCFVLHFFQHYKAKQISDPTAFVFVNVDTEKSKMRFNGLQIIKNRKLFLRKVQDVLDTTRNKDLILYIQWMSVVKALIDKGQYKIALRVFKKNAKKYHRDATYELKHIVLRIILRSVQSIFK